MANESAGGAVGTPLRAKRDRYGLVQLVVTVAGAAAGVVAAVVADFGVGGVIGTGVAAAAGGLALGTKIARKFFAEVVDPVRAAAAARAEVNERLATALRGGVGFTPLRIADPYAIGVLRSAVAEEPTRQPEGRPPYVPRSIDGALAEQLTTAGASGSIVIVAGPPKAGKSRTLFEALAHSPTTRDRTLYALRTPDSTEGATTTRPLDAVVDTATDINGRTSVLWIDDAHEHFAYGLTLARLTKLRERHKGLIVAMTVHTDQLQPPPRRTPAGELSAVDVDLLAHLADVALDLATTFTSQEQDAARAAYPELLDDIEHPVDFERLPSWFAGVDYLRNRYYRAGPAHYGGKAIARAAINWRRAGMPAGINDARLHQLADIALDELDPGAAFTDEDSYANALAWACGVDAGSEARWHGIALVRPMPGSSQTLWRDFDAVTTWAASAPHPDPPLSHRSWEAVLDGLTRDTGLPVGVAAADAGEVAISIAAHRVAAEAGDADAMANLGVLFSAWLDPPELEEARHWLNRAATAGHTAAMNNLGVLLADRLDRPELDEARRWYERAADTGDADAMANLGVLFSARLDPPELDEARRWYQRAAEAGHIGAMYRLGALLADQLDPPELDEARRWYQRAAEAGHTDAMASLGLLLEARLDPPELDEARRWYQRAAEAGHLGAMGNLSLLLATGLDPPEFDEARRWLKRAAEAGHTDAMYNLGLLLADRLDPPELDETRRWYQQAAEAGHTHAMNNLGALLADQLDPPELDEARRWYQQAAEAGHTDAMFNLGALLTYRLDPPQLDEARRWYQQAAEAGQTDAMYYLGALLADRLDPPELDEARRWWERAADAGQTDAIAALRVNRPGSRDC